MATKLGRTGTSSTNATKFTWSAWVRRANIGSGGMMLYNYLNGDNRAYLQFQADNKIYYYDKDGGNIQASLTTTALYSDPNAWYHICLIGDSTDGTQGDRIQLYVNGVRQTMTGTYPGSSVSLGMKVHTGTNYHVIGTNSDSTSNPFLGVMSHVHYIDGIDYPATTFGSTDAVTGEWKITTNPGISTSNYGNNGYFVLKDGNSGTDQSGNSHNLTVTSGTLSKTEDCPSNVFATLNPLSVRDSNYVATYGNTRINTGGSTEWGGAIAATMGATGGKFYWEVKWNAGDSYSITGVIPANKYHTCALTSGTAVYTYANGVQLSTSGTGTIYNAASSNGNFVQQSVGSIYSFALDMENKKMWIGVNGTWYNSGNPGAGSNETWGSSEFVADDVWVPYAQGYQISNDTTFNFNFGNGTFEGANVASAGTNASNNGIFEYDVPTGFTALSTKGLNL